MYYTVSEQIYSPKSKGTLEQWEILLEPVLYNMHLSIQSSTDLPTIDFEEYRIPALLDLLTPTTENLPLLEG